MNQVILNSIQQASKVIGKTWPLYSFVASNPLSGYENISFKEALSSAQNYLKANVFPKANLYRQAWENGDICENELIKLLKKNSLSDSPENYLKLLELQKRVEEVNPNHEVDRIMAKWLAAFMDEGLAEWDMPYKEEGFYTAWRNLVIYDSELGVNYLNDIPKTSIETLEYILKDYPESDYVKIFSYHLASLPGWTGYINHRNESNSDWHNDFPINLMDYLAVRLWVTKKVNTPLFPTAKIDNSESLIFKLQYVFLKAWERTWQNQFLRSLTEDSKTNFSSKDVVPEAQLVFCIDTRSELIRRHVEAIGNYETYGYAGFFGIAMDYESLTDGITRKSCPPIVNSAYKVSEKAQIHKEENFMSFKKRSNQSKFGKYILNRMKNMLPSAFGFVELSGVHYGIALIFRTLFPNRIFQLGVEKSSQMETFCDLKMDCSSQTEHEHDTIPLTEKVAIVKSAFNLMGWKEFAPIVLFVGHGSHSANNPFSSSLDCGACAASHGRHNARMLAKLANLPEVRDELANNHDINIPKGTIFIGAEHNTTTDEIIFFDSEVGEKHRNQLQQLKESLTKAQKTATQERLGISSNSVTLAQRKANDWGETRPEWGLAKNAGFIVGSRNLTKNKNLDSRCFLHSYDWEQDTTGKALEGIMQGPMVVTQWINNHYYFSTVDNNTFGGGSKITHNITGKFGVVQGNGGDLKMGLPEQSLFDSSDIMYHQPLRLSVLINAPINRVSEILIRNTNLQALLDNEWIYLMVSDPTASNKVFCYKKSMQWVSTSKNDLDEIIKRDKFEELALTELKI